MATKVSRCAWHRNGNWWRRRARAYDFIYIIFILHHNIMMSWSMNAHIDWKYDFFADSFFLFDKTVKCNPSGLFAYFASLFQVIWSFAGCGNFECVWRMMVLWRCHWFWRSAKGEQRYASVCIEPKRKSWLNESAYVRTCPSRIWMAHYACILTLRRCAGMDILFIILSIL